MNAYKSTFKPNYFQKLPAVSLIGFLVNVQTSILIESAAI